MCSVASFGTSTCTLVLVFKFVSEGELERVLALLIVVIPINSNAEVIQNSDTSDDPSVHGTKPPPASSFHTSFVIFHLFTFRLIPLTMECDSKRIQRVHLYKAKLAAGIGKRRFRLYHVVFVLCYVYQVIYVISTIGQPYRLFIEKADREGFEGS